MSTKQIATEKGEYCSLYVVGKQIGDAKAEEIVHALLPRCGLDLAAVIPQPRQVFEIVLRSEKLYFELERDGFPLKGKQVQVYPSVPRGTWVRVRGIPLFWTDSQVKEIFREYGPITSGPTEIMYRDTPVSTGDRSMKIDLVRSIPQDILATSEGESFAITVRYREQPKACFACGEEGHLKHECPHNNKKSMSYSHAVASNNNTMQTYKTQTTQQNPKQSSIAPTQTHDSTPNTQPPSCTPSISPQTCTQPATTPTKHTPSNTHTRSNNNKQNKNIKKVSPRNGRKRKGDHSTEKPVKLANVGAPQPLQKNIDFDSDSDNDINIGS